MSQGYIGYHIQQCLRYALNKRNRNVPVVTLATQMVVEKSDPAFQNPTKPIGAFYSQEEARHLEQERATPCGRTRAGAGAGWWPLPAPADCGDQRGTETLGGHHRHHLRRRRHPGGGKIPTAASPAWPPSSTKDFAAELLAEEVHADVLMILTEVERVAIRWGKPDQKDLSHLTLSEAARYVDEGHFGVGSMLPKVQAAMKFVRTHPDRKAIITSLDKALDALEGQDRHRGDLCISEP